MKRVGVGGGGQRGYRMYVSKGISMSFLRWFTKEGKGINMSLFFRCLTHEAHLTSIATNNAKPKRKITEAMMAPIVASPLYMDKV